MYAIPPSLYVTLSCSSPTRREELARALRNATNAGSVSVCIIEQCPNLPATPATPSHRSHPRPLSLLAGTQVHQFATTTTTRQREKKRHVRPLTASNHPAGRFLGQLGIPGTLLQFGLPGHLTKVGHFGCHGLDQLLVPIPWIKNLELQAGKTQQILASMELVLHCCLVLAQKVEQSAHLPRGLLRLPACLVSAEGSKSVCVLSRVWWILWQTLSALVDVSAQQC